MRQILLSLIVLIQTTNVFSVPQNTGGDRVWRKGSYRGLTVGMSTRADMLRVLGKPLSSGPSADQDPPYPIVWHDYGRISGEISGTLAVEVDKRNNRIVQLSVSPDSMTKEEAIKRLKVIRDADEVAAMLVANLPPNCGPAVDGTADDFVGL